MGKIHILIGEQNCGKTQYIKSLQNKFDLIHWDCESIPDLSFVDKFNEISEKGLDMALEWNITKIQDLYTFFKNCDFVNAFKWHKVVIHYWKSSVIEKPVDHRIDEWFHTFFKEMTIQIIEHLPNPSKDFKSSEKLGLSIPFNFLKQLHSKDVYWEIFKKYVGKTPEDKSGYENCNDYKKLDFGLFFDKDTCLVSKVWRIEGHWIDCWDEGCDIYPDNEPIFQELADLLLDITFQDVSKKQLAFIFENMIKYDEYQITSDYYGGWSKLAFKFIHLPTLFEKLKEWKILKIF